MNKESIATSNSVHGYILRFLIKLEEVKTMKEIVQHIEKERKIKGKTPQNTIRGIIQRSKYIKKNIHAKYEIVK